jgi:hypothetical protein
MPDPNFIAPQDPSPPASPALLKPTPEEQFSILPTRTPPRTEPPKKSHRTEYIMIFVAAFVLIVGGLALLYFAGRH